MRGDGRKVRGDDESMPAIVEMIDDLAGQCRALLGMGAPSDLVEQPQCRRVDLPPVDEAPDLATERRQIRVVLDEMWLVASDVDDRFDGFECEVVRRHREESLSTPLTETDESQECRFPPHVRAGDDGRSIPELEVDRLNGPVVGSLGDARISPSLELHARPGCPPPFAPAGIELVGQTHLGTSDVDFD